MNLKQSHLNVQILKLQEVLHIIKIKQLYISNVEFCGKEDTTKYKEISCSLYESYKNTKTKISNCNTMKNINLENYLKEINIEVEHYSKSCKNLKENNLSLEINAIDTNNKTITYEIPIKLNDTCKEK